MQYWVNAVGFGVFTIPAIARVWAGKDIPMVLGFPADGQGPFEHHGIKSTVRCAGFLVVCILEGVAGWLLCGGHRSGAILRAALSFSCGAVYWWGFALPVPPVFAVIRTVLIVAGWQSLTR